MPRKRKMTLAAINITTEPPHAPERYLSIFRMLQESDKPLVGRLGGPQNITLGYCSIKASYVEGVFVSFTQIDPNSPWWDTEARKALVDEQGQPIPQVRKGIGPNTKHISFFFFAKHHRLVIDLRNVSAKGFAKGLESLFSNEQLSNEFGKINVTVEPKRNIIDEIVKLQHKSQINISISLPNSDAPSQMEKKIVQRLKTLGVARTEQTFRSSRGGEMTQDEELLATMKIGQSNGYVEAVGYGEDGKSITLSTKDYPLLYSESYEADAYWKSLPKFAKKLLNLIRGNSG